MAIEIAASMCRTLPCRQVAALVAERIDALEVHAPDIPVRQRRMSLVFAFAWERLSETQRQILHALCVFRAGFTVDAAVAVCTHDGVLNTTTVMQALELFVLHTSVAQHGQRYTLHPMLRQYVLETRGQVPADLAAAAAETFLALLADPDLRRVQVATMLVCERLEPEYQNIAASWDWAVRAGKGSGLGHTRGRSTRCRSVSGTCPRWRTCSRRLRGGATSSLRLPNYASGRSDCAFVWVSLPRSTPVVRTSPQTPLRHRMCVRLR